MYASSFQAIELFSTASRKTIHQLSNLASDFFYKKNTLVLDYDQSIQNFLYVTAGWLKLCKVSVDGEEIIIDVLSKDHHCGESLIFNPSKEEVYMAYALSNIEGFTLPLAELKQLMVYDNGLALSFLQAMSQKQLLLNAHIEHLSIQNAIQRIGCFLLRLSNNTNRNYNAPIVLHLPYNKVILALKLGMRPETFSRALNKLHKWCGIDINGEYISINNPRKLICYVCQHCSKTFPCNLPID
ncbi:MULTISPECIES: Crp/Fnr family transcriptional regulator [Francisella]|uniref:Crp/Fnr family transcriptional regulator n=1 Tax=Francisella opportunistica TaxID=2016517 RepID=A0A345JRH3_9GAMM|nr:MULTISPECIES: Crp/Fnr family transcriptional regulator [Francisella]APC91648.1 Transcriptional Regulator, Crp/Fnr family [Francisella sp. MA067296]AXH29919.1 Crp/Fnr family transcriptional regulator [Francisella opportunistica]AXH31566.1 Crp/Fnr family transcriptional regulator [Francisella opportunistica]AXH33214.1 Crp/Fnr family transcriptional regulator [Francisella opportunistica]